MKTFFEFYKKLHEGGGHVGSGGVQSWSAGEIYPFHIMIKKGLGPSGSVVLMHPEMGEVETFPFDDMETDFSSAHAAAEHLAKKMMTARKDGTV